VAGLEVSTEPPAVPCKSTKKCAISASFERLMPKPLVSQVLRTLGRGGAERMVLDLCRRLPGHGFDVEVLAAEGGGDLEVDLRSAGIRVAINPNPNSRRASVAFLRDAIRRRRPAVWHTHLTHVWAGIAARTTGVSPWIATAHGSEPGRSMAARLARRTAYRRADHVVCVSDAVRRSIHRTYGLSPSHTSVIPPGIDLDRFAAREPRRAGDLPELVTVGRLSPEKGFDTVLCALSELIRPWHLTVVGDGPEGSPLRRLAETLGLLPRIRFVGAVSDPSPYLRRADLFCMPSQHEGQGIALLEAAASRLPAIASDLPVLRETFGDEAVLLVPARDVAAWRSAIERVLNHYPEALGRAERAERIVRSGYSLDAMLEKHVDLYRRVLRAV